MSLRLGLRLSLGAARPDEVSLWQARATSNGGAIEHSTLTASRRFLESAKTKGYRSKLLRLNLLCGSNLAAALTPLIADRGPATDTNYNFTSGDYSAAGLKGQQDGTKYLETQIVASSIGYNDAHLSYYGSGMEIMSGTGAPGLIGCRDPVTTANRMTILAYHPAGFRFAVLGAPNASILPANSIANGFLLATADVSVCNFYQNTQVAASVARQAGAFGNETIKVLTWLPNTGGAGTESVCKSYSIGTNLSAADVANFYADLQTFFTDIGRPL